MHGAALTLLRKIILMNLKMISMISENHPDDFFLPFGAAASGSARCFGRRPLMAVFLFLQGLLIAVRRTSLLRPEYRSATGWPDGWCPDGATGW